MPPGKLDADDLMIGIPPRLSVFALLNCVILIFVMYSSTVYCYPFLTWDHGSMVKSQSLDGVKDISY